MEKADSRLPAEGDLERTLARLVETAGVPAWLAESVRAMAANVDLIPFTEDEDRYVVECIYPH